MKCNSPTLLPTGIRLQVDSEQISPLKELCVCIAGSTAGIISGLLISHFTYDIFDTFVFSSFSLSLLNLLPIKGLDGGEILNIVSNRRFLPDKAYNISKTISNLAILMLWFITITLHMSGEYNLTMLIFTLYLIYSGL